jgi:hypothetical protein
VTDRERLAAGLARLREGGWTLGKVLVALIGLLIAFVVLSPIMLLSVVALLFTWTGLPGLHWLGHAIERHMTTPVLDAFIGASERMQSLADKKRQV